MRQMAGHGRALLLRLRGVHFTALGFADATGAPSEVRVVTAHGIALALDATAGHALRPGRSWRLLSSPLPLAGQAAATSDEYVFVEERVKAREPCVRVFRVRPGGEVEPEGRVADPTGRAACAVEDADAVEAGDVPEGTNTTSQRAR